MLGLGAAGCSRERIEAQGQVTALDAASRAVTIRRDDVAGATQGIALAFALDDPARLDGLVPGARVRFAYSQRIGGLWRTLDAIEPIGGMPRTHDHRPRHGGVVEMIDRLHVEAAAGRDGRVRLWLTDFWRSPLALTGTSGTVTAIAAGRTQTVPVRVAGDALEATAAAFDGSRVELHAALVRDGRALDAAFVIPFDDAMRGVSGRISKRCRTLPARAAGRPRCTIRFARPVSALATAGRGDLAVAAGDDGQPSLWRPSTGELLGGLEAPPPEPGDSGMHAHQPPLAALSADGRRAFLTAGDRVLRYDVGDARLAGSLPLKGAQAGTMAASPDGRSVAVANRFGASALVYDFDANRVVRTVPAAREITVTSFSPDGRWLAVGDEGGHVTVAGLDGGADRTFNGLAQSARGLAFAGDDVVGLGRDGVLAVWRATEGVARLRVDTDVAGGRLAVSDDGALAAVAGEQRVRLYALADGRLLDTVTLPNGRIAGIALSGANTLLVTDARGRLTIRDLAAR